MPFTPSHVLAVVPLRRKLPFLALAVGAMVPDFGYFFPWGPYFYESAHTLVRSLTFCLPVGLICWALIVATERGWKRLLPPVLGVSPLRGPLWAVALAIWVGTLTHLFWDSWTHADGYFVERYPGLPFRWLQHLSSVAAIAVMGAWLWRRYDRTLVALTRAQWKYWAFVAVGAGIFGWIRYASPEHSGLSGEKGLFILITSCMGSALSIVAVTSVALTLLNEER